MTKMISNANLFIIFNFFVVLGIFLNNLFEDFKAFLILGAFFAILTLINFYHTKTLRKASITALSAIFIGFFISGINSYLSSSKLSYLEKITHDFNKKAEIELTLQSNYKSYSTGDTFIAKLDKFDGQIVDKNLSIMVSVWSTKNLKKGDKIRLKTVIDKVDNFTENFNYPKFLLSKGVYGKINTFSHKKIGKQKFGYLDSLIISIKTSLRESANNLYPSNEAFLIRGLLIGDREDFGDELMLQFNASGLTHIIAVSGYNITIIILFLVFLLQKIPAILRTIIILSSIVFFVILVGAEPPVVRAGIMGFIGYLIIASGREAYSLSLISITLLLMTLYSPYSINYDISLHLSFLALVGILYLKPILDNLFGSFKTNILAQSLTITISATLLTMPIMIFNFSQFSLISPVSNILVTPLIPFTMLYGFIGISLYSFSETLGQIIGYIGYAMLHYIIKIAEFFGSQSYSLLKVDLGFFSPYFSVSFLLLIILSIILLQKKEA